MTDPGEKLIEGVPVSGLTESSPKVSALPPAEELPTRFEVKARILDFYPIALDEENCLLRVCGDCNNLSVSCGISFYSPLSNTSLKDREGRRVMPQLFESNISSACHVPFLAPTHVGYGKRRGARGSSRKHRCES